MDGVNRCGERKGRGEVKRPRTGWVFPAWKLLSRSSRDLSDLLRTAEIREGERRRMNRWRTRRFYQTGPDTPVLDPQKEKCLGGGGYWLCVRFKSAFTSAVFRTFSVSVRFCRQSVRATLNSGEKENRTRALGYRVSFSSFLLSVCTSFHPFCLTRSL